MSDADVLKEIIRTKAKSGPTSTSNIADDDIDLGQCLPDLAKTAVMQGFIKAMAAAHISRGKAKTNQAVDSATKDLLNHSLSLRDFWDFNQKLGTSLSASFQGSPDSPELEQKAAGGAKGSGCPADGKVRWYCLFASYFVDYYNGKFSDRDGSVLSKPKLGLTITNETITGVGNSSFGGHI